MTIESKCPFRDSGIICVDGIRYKRSFDRPQKLHPLDLDGGDDRPFLLYSGQCFQCAKVTKC